MSKGYLIVEVVDYSVLSCFYSDFQTFSPNFSSVCWGLIIGVRSMECNGGPAPWATT